MGEMNTVTAKRKWFTSLKGSTQQEWDILSEEERQLGRGLADRVLDHLLTLGEQETEFPLSRLGHSLQTATRASRAGRDDQYVLCALLHDIGDTLGTFNHGDIAAAIVKDFVRSDYHWMVEQHPVFQGYYFFQFVGRDRDEREKFRGHEHFDLTAEFCEEFDQAAFDPGYPTMAVEEFRPLVRALMATPLRAL
jgi:predicted HD phosphohydrolase